MCVSVFVTDRKIEKEAPSKTEENLIVFLNFIFSSFCIKTLLFLFLLLLLLFSWINAGQETG